jgi:hypothetical protein
VGSVKGVSEVSAEVDDLHSLQAGRTLLFMRQNSQYGLLLRLARTGLVSPVPSSLHLLFLMSDRILHSAGFCKVF